MSLAPGEHHPDPDVPAEGERADDGLDRRSRDILALEAQTWRHAGAKEAAVRERLGLGPTRYYQLLNALIDDPAALAAEPTLVNRLRRQRLAGQRSQGPMPPRAALPRRSTQPREDAPVQDTTPSRESA